MDPIHTETYKGFTINIMHDSDPMNPREWDNLGTMLCIHSRYNLGDDYKTTLKDIHEICSLKPAVFIVLPLYLYDHSGITMNTSGFSCPWDSGQVGIIYVSLQDIRKVWKVKRVSKKLREKVINNLISEVKEYDNFITGNCYGYDIEGTNESCWGFLGDYDGYCLQEAKETCNYLEKLQLQEDINIWQNFGFKTAA